jgi:hypothetical protein
LHRSLNRFPVCVPKGGVAVEYGPVPSRSVIRRVNVELTSEQLEKQIRIIEGRQMHYIHSEYIWHGERHVGQTVEKSLLTQTNGEAPTLEFDVCVGLKQKLEIVVVFLSEIDTVQAKIGVTNVGVNGASDLIVVWPVHGRVVMAVTLAMPTWHVAI